MSNTTVYHSAEKISANFTANDACLYWLLISISICFKLGRQASVYQFIGIPENIFKHNAKGVIFWEKIRAVMLSLQYNITNKMQYNITNKMQYNITNKLMQYNITNKLMQYNITNKLM